MRYHEILAEFEGSATLYHGTSQKNAEYFAKHGFGTSQRAGGITNSSDPHVGKYTCLTRNLRTAKFYTWNSSGQNGAIVVVKYPLNAFKVDGYNGMKGWVDIYRAFGIAGDHFEVPRPKPNHLNIDGIAKMLLSKGYTAIEFKDSWSDGRNAIVALDPAKIELVRAFALGDYDKEEQRSERDEQLVSRLKHRSMLMPNFSGEDITLLKDAGFEPELQRASDLEQHDLPTGKKVLVVDLDEPIWKTKTDFYYRFLDALERGHIIVVPSISELDPSMRRRVDSFDK